MYIDPIARMSKVHLWIGVTHKTRKVYEEYFDQENNKLCQFCKDVGMREYQEDFIGILPIFPEVMNIDDVLLEAPVSLEDIPQVKEKCLELGISEANALFWYSDSELAINKPYKENYNDLKYIGIFEGD